VFLNKKCLKSLAKFDELILPQLSEKIQHGVKKIECFMLFLCGDRKKCLYPVSSQPLIEVQSRLLQTQ